MARPKWPLIRRISSAHIFPVRLNYMVWKRLQVNFCLIRGHFGLGRSDHRQFQAHTSVTSGQFERIFFKFFLFSYWLLLSLVRVNIKKAFSSELHLKIWWVWLEPRGPADRNCRSPQEKILNQSRSRRFYAKLSKFIYSVESINKWHTHVNFLIIFFDLFSLAILSELAFC